MSEHMLECDSCDEKYPALEFLRGTGDAGVRFAREISACQGWTSDEATDTDTCPNCVDRLTQPKKGEPHDHWRKPRPDPMQPRLA